MATGGSASAASEIEVGSICPTLQELRAAAAKQADTCVAGAALYGMWRVSPYVGIHIGGTGWIYGGPLIAKKTQILLKVKQRRQLADAPVLIRLKMRFRPMARLVGCVFCLILVLPVFGHKRTRCTRYITGFGRCPYFFVDVPLAVFVNPW